MSNSDAKTASIWGNLTWTERLARILALALAGFIIEVVSGHTLLAQAISGTAAKIFAPVLSWGYAHRDNNKIAEQITVVDVDIPLVQRTPGGWPFTYGHHARILDQIRRQKPKALFVDFQFQSPREDPTLPQFLEVLCAFKADRIPVFLAAGTETSRGMLRPELEGLHNAQGERCFEKVAVQYEPSSTDHVAWTYQLHGSSGDQVLSSAGLAMAEAMTGKPIAVGHEHDNNMGLTWVGGIADQGPKWLEETSGHSENNEGTEHDVRHYCKDLSPSDLFPLRDWIVALQRHAPDHRPACPRHASVPAAWLTAPKTEDQANDLKSRIFGKGIFYGGSFDANDFALSPIHDRIPGVFMHSQATDNLIRYGDNWRRAELGVRSINNHAIEHLVVFLGFLVISFFFALGSWLLKLLLLPVSFVYVWACKSLPLIWHKGIQTNVADNRGSNKRYQLTAMAGEHTKQHYKLHAIAALIFHKLVEFFRRISWFYISLVIAAIPVSLFLETIFNASLIAYAPLLAFALTGEVFMYKEEAEKEFESGPHANNSAPNDLPQEQPK